MSTRAGLLQLLLLLVLLSSSFYLLRYIIIRILHKVNKTCNQKQQDYSTINRPSSIKKLLCVSSESEDNNNEQQACVQTSPVHTITVKVKVHILDIAPLGSESSAQRRSAGSGMARVIKGFHSFTCTPTRSSAIGMSHTCLCLPSYNWYSFTDPGGMEG